MARSSKKTSDARKKRRKERSRRGLKLRANRSPDLSESESPVDGHAADLPEGPPPAPATDLRSHWIRWGSLVAVALASGAAVGAAVSVQIGLVAAVAVMLGGAAFLIMFFPPPVHEEGGDPAGLNFGRAKAEDGASEDEPPPNRATRRAQRDSS